MRFFVYILRNDKNQLYIGQTNNFDRRFQEHNDTFRSSWAARRGPWVVLCVQEFDSRSAAMKREKYLKSLKRKDKILRESKI